MTSLAQHRWIVGRTARDRRALIDTGPSPDVLARCHVNRRGPFSGLSCLLTELVGDVQRGWPELVVRHRVAIVTVAPALEALTGPVPKSLTALSKGEERTRYQDGLSRRAAHGIVELLNEYAARREPSPLTLAFDEIDEADGTDQEFLAVLLRRADPALIRVVVAGAGEPAHPELARALAAHAVRHDAPPQPRETPDDAGGLRAFVMSDGASDEPAERAAWEHADPAQRAALHDARARELEQAGEPGYLLGAVPFHHEHGSDPAGRGVRALDFALDHCIGVGFYPAAIALARRGLALVDPATQEEDYWLFSAKLALCLSGDRPEEAEAIYDDVRARYRVPRMHMTSSYGIAMLYTRFHDEARRDHTVARTFVNNAIALASQIPEPQARAFYTVFSENGLALVEVNDGNPEESLRLLGAGMGRLDRELPPDRHRVHRSVLVHNRARVYSAMGRLEDALRDFDTVVAMDPNYAEYYLDRANMRRRLGQHAAAIDDLERAMALSAPFPELYYNRADARATLGDAAGALADFDYVLELEPDDVNAHVNCAALRLESGDLDRAAHHVGEGLRLDPDEPHLLCTGGLVEIERGNVSGARELLARSLAASPGMGAALVNAAVAAHADGDFDAAVDLLTEALQQGAEDDAVLLYNRAYAHESAGRWQEAIADYTRALELPDADRPEILLHRALCLTAQRRDLEELAGTG
jgi:tetratricopeptide (TPR) repeat protein